VFAFITAECLQAAGTTNCTPVRSFGPCCCCRCSLAGAAFAPLARRLARPANWPAMCGAAERGSISARRRTPSGVGGRHQLERKQRTKTKRRRPRMRRQRSAAGSLGPARMRARTNFEPANRIAHAAAANWTERHLPTAEIWPPAARAGAEQTNESGRCLLMISSARTWPARLSHGRPAVGRQAAGRLGDYQAAAIRLAARRKRSHRLASGQPAGWPASTSARPQLAERHTHTATRPARNEKSSAARYESGSSAVWAHHSAERCSSRPARPSRLEHGFVPIAVRVCRRELAPTPAAH
jgi:hypothetical protein